MKTVRLLTIGNSFADNAFAFLEDIEEAPALPRQEKSLAKGWHWVINRTPDGIPELRLDANHQNAAGCYLAGCVWYEWLAKADVRPAAFHPEGVAQETAAFLRDTAHEACVSYT